MIVPFYLLMLQCSRNMRQEPGGVLYPLALYGPSKRFLL